MEEKFKHKLKKLKYTSNQTKRGFRETDGKYSYVRRQKMRLKSDSRRYLREEGKLSEIPKGRRETQRDT